MSALFSSLFDEILFWVVFVGGLVWHFFAILQVGGARQPVKKREKEPLMVPFSLVLFTMIIPISVGYLRIGVLPNYLFYPGLVIMIAGFIVYYWAVLALGRFASGFVQVIPDHKVVQKGPYRFLRHPIYASEILSFVGLGLALQSWVALVVVLIGGGVFYGIHIRTEERFLTAELGDEYVQYMKNVKRIIPHIL